VKKRILEESLPGIQQLIDEVEGAINRVKSKLQDAMNKICTGWKMPFLPCMLPLTVSYNNRLHRIQRERRKA